MKGTGICARTAGMDGICSAANSIAPDPLKQETTACSSLKPARPPKLLFLDIDGVCNNLLSRTNWGVYDPGSYGVSEFNCLMIEQAVMTSKAQIVFHSSWRRHPEGYMFGSDLYRTPLPRLLKRFSKLLYPPLNGLCRLHEGAGKVYDILDAVLETGCEDWLAVDDEPLPNMHLLGDRLIITNRRTGFTAVEAVKVVAHFNETKI